MQDGECKDPDGELHQLASMWDTVNCERCVCGEIGIQCCSKLPIPVSYDKRKCQKIFNRKNCTYSVVERDDPRKKCVVLSWIV
ncbi:beta-microseminoprotein [Castor canadensis]|uniref:Beta-microseminoprotein n=1 Tax=Castor canadensis TaxID=51338 RepID=A0AC58MX89_CASCN